MDYYKMKMMGILELFYRDDTYSFLADLEKVKNESFAPHDLPSLTAAEEKIFSIILAGNGGAETIRHSLLVHEGWHQQFTFNGLYLDKAYKR